MEFSDINLLKKCKSKHIPFSATFELTPFCNFSCNMCYVRLSPAQASKQGRLLSAEEWINLAKETSRLGTWSVTLTGGEVFTRPDFCRIYEAIYDLGLMITLRTNGYLLNSTYLDLLKKKKPYRIMITLYGASDETYYRICGIKDGFSVVSSSIDTLLQSDIPVAVTMTVTTQNINDIAELKEWCSKRNLHLSLFRGLSNPNDGTERSIEGLYTRPTDEECTVSDEMCSKNIVSNRDELEGSPFSICKGYGATYDICWNGKMVVCNTLLSIWENPFETSLLDAYNKLYARLDKLKRPDQCIGCNYINYCLGCPAKLYSETRNPEKTCEEICRIARYRFKYAMLAKEKMEEFDEPET